jgi:hypothetical protein
VVRRAAFAGALVGLLAVAGCGSSTAAYDPVPAATAGSGTGTLFARGTVTSAGEPVAGAKVVLQVAPPGDRYGAATPGEKRWSAPAVTTGADGSWSVHLRASAVPATYLPDSHSYLEFDLVFGDGARLAVWSGTVYLRSDPDVWRTEGAGPDDGVLTLAADLDSGDVTAKDSRGAPLATGR